MVTLTFTPFCCIIVICSIELAKFLFVLVGQIIFKGKNLWQTKKPQTSRLPSQTRGLLTTLPMPWKGSFLTVLFSKEEKTSSSGPPKRLWPKSGHFLRKHTSVSAPSVSTLPAKAGWPLFIMVCFSLKKERRFFENVAPSFLYSSNFMLLFLLSL